MSNYEKYCGFILYLMILRLYLGIQVGKVQKKGLLSFVFYNSNYKIATLASYSNELPTQYKCTLICRIQYNIDVQ